jgi:hypothetical protein
MKLLIDLDDDYEKIGCEMPSGTPVGKCRLHSDAFPPAAEKIEFGITSMRHQLPAIFDITDVPDTLREHPKAIIQQLIAAPISTHGGNHVISYDKLTSGKVIRKSRHAMNNQERLETLVNRFQLKARDIARMTRRKPTSVYGWTSQRKLSGGKRLKIPTAPLELLRYKLGDKELIRHYACWRVAPEDRLTRHAVMWGGEKIAFWDLPNNEQIKAIVKEYNLSAAEISKMTHKHIGVCPQWTTSPENDGYREIPTAELELILLKLDERRLVLDEKVPPALRRRLG